MKFPRVIWNPGWSKLGQVAGAIWILMTTLLICARILLPYYGINLASEKAIPKIQKDAISANPPSEGSLAPNHEHEVLKQAGAMGQKDKLRAFEDATISPQMKTNQQGGIK